MNTTLKCIIVLIISTLCFFAKSQGYVDTIIDGNTYIIVDDEYIISVTDDVIDDPASAFYDDEDLPAMFVEEMPKFPGGQDSLNAFLSREIQYPPIAKKNGISGTVLIEFVVEKDGRVTNGVVKVSLSPDCDEEALRGVMAMPKWKPGKNMGKPVRCYFMVPITFRP